MNLNDKVAVVTGAAQGIGRAIAETLARRGADVVVADLQAERAEATAKEITASTGRRAVAVQVNVADNDSAKAMIDRAITEFGRIDILVNNAGITRDNLIMRVKEEDWDLVLDVNLKGAFLFTKALARVFLKQRSGRIINIASVIGLMGNAGQCTYAASKAGLIGFTKSCAREFASRGVTVNAIAPGFIQTAMTDKLSPEQKDAIAKQIPLATLGTPDDVAHAVWFFALPASRYITGQVLPVDGGMVM